MSGLEDLAVAAAAATGSGRSRTNRPAAEPKEPFPWDFALLGGSVFGSVIGAFTFGVPPLAVGAASAVYAMRARNGAKRVAAVSAVICVFGVALGVVISRFVWFNVPLWGWQMIRFACLGCGGQFNVPETFAGRQARCKKCGNTIVVPPATQTAAAHTPPVRETSVATRARPPVPIASTPKIPVRSRRLIADMKQMREAFGDGSLIRILQTEGDPAEVYKVEYNIRGIETLKRNKPVFREQHIAEIRMMRDYPRMAPACRMLTPIFHPNIDESAICVGDHWVAGERLTDLAVRIGQMIAYQTYNIKSPLNGEAAMWADLNPNALPIDNRDLYPPVLEPTV